MLLRFNFAERERITVTNVASTMLTMMANNPLMHLANTTSLRVLSCGGSPQSPAVLMRAVAALGCEIFLSYGMTEVCGKISMSILPYGWWRRSQVSVGGLP